MTSILVAGIDPGFANMGIARMRLDLDSGELAVDDLILTRTKPGRDRKVVRASSDDLRRAIELREALLAGVQGCGMVFAEVPSGAQSAKAARGLGIAVGLLAASPIQVVEVQPDETKLASVGRKTAGKAEIIAWAMALYPDAPWERERSTGRPIDANEHLADAVAVVHAGLGTPDCKRLLALMKTARVS